MASRPTISAWDGCTSLSVASGIFGTNSTCTGACGAMSRNAIRCSSSWTMSAGISRRMILWKMVSGMAIPPGSPRIAGAVLRRHLAATAERMCQRAAVHVFQLATQRHAVRKPARRDALLARELRQVVRGRLAFDGRVGGDDQFPYL